ncbi:MAG TPA: hypothetical protein VHV52_11225 [Gaiellaceae bacterium]|jgi:hypothetical protein|nr:hypothetical protein [Gaiellaceae bacterium]
MVRKLATASISAMLLAPLAWASAGGGPVPPVDGAGASGSGVATAKLSNSAAGARTALTVGLHAELQCGRLSARTLTVKLPSQLRVPHLVAVSAVTAGGKPVTHAKVSGSTVVLTLPVPKGVTCDVLGPGVYPVVFLSRAGLRNPLGSGSYAFSVLASPRGDAWHGTLAVG